MESTGVYWIPLFEELESEGFECLLISSRSLRKVAGQKTDVEDAQWVQTLHSYGLLKGSFRPQGDLVALRTLLRAYRQDGFPVTIVRPSLTYGLSQIPLCVNSWQHPYTVIERMKQGKKIIIPGDGTSLWVFTWNEDFARGFLGLFGRKDAIGEAFQITSDEVLTWNQAYEEVGHALGVKLDVVHIASDLIAKYDDHAIGSLIGDKVNSVVFDNSKIKRFVPDFECKTPWVEGVRRALAWFEADPARQTIDSEANQLWDKIINSYEKAFPEQ